MRLVLGLCVGFWCLIFVAGLANPGYVHYRFHVSVLAADGNRLIWVTTVAILLVAAAQWAAARLFWRVNRPVAILLSSAGLALVAVAAFRVPCPRNARYCPYTVEHTPAETVHNSGVIVYAVLTMAAMLILGVIALTQGRHSLVGIPGLIACGLFAMTFTGLFVFPAGLAQRVWIGVGQAWLIAASFEAEQHRERVAA